MKSFIVAWSVFVAIAFIPASVFSKSSFLSEAIADLDSVGQDKILAAAGALVKAKSRPARSASGLAWECLATIQLAGLGYEGSLERLASIADDMLLLAVKSRGTEKTIGWSSAAKNRACGFSEKNSRVPSACEGTDIVYAFQSGLGMACLVPASIILQRSDLMNEAKDVMSYWRLRIKKAPCDDCVYFAMSDSPTDEDRYVRNMNLFLAFGASELGVTAKLGELLVMAKKAVRSDIWERENGNRGYFGKLDPLWTSRPGEAERIENHSAFVAVLLTTMAKKLSDQAFDRHALTVWRDWATCDNQRCQTAGCTYWAGDPSECQATATAAHCAFRFRDNTAKSKCTEYLSRVGNVNAYGIWAILQAHQ